MNKKSPIGVIDSGVGGLTVLKCLLQHLPNENFLYLGDTLRAPYGSRPREEIQSFVDEMIDWLVGQGVKQVVVACNTITMLGLENIKKDYHFDIVGMSKGEHLLLKTTQNKKIGVIATEFTIKSEAHKKAVLDVDPSAEVIGVPCPKFVPLIEGEQFSSQELKDAVDEYAAVLKEHDVDTVIMSCTHFPFVRSLLQASLGESVTLIDPADETSELAKMHLEGVGLLNDGPGSVTICCTTGLERVQRLAAREFNIEKCVFKVVKLAD
ncbi:MAG: glutamate racemase [Phascolarctobacterium sp.]|nr:glutamate racemase [Phascolarctobacterium sp.]